ncbi:MAG: hypothetical protein WCP82_12130, partial [Alphaproteobacteria bacterium]
MDAKPCEHCAEMFVPVRSAATRFCSQRCRHAQYHKDNKEGIAEYGAQYHKDNKERIAEREAQYREDN